MQAERFYRCTLTAIALGALVLQVLAAGPLRDSFWGFHLLAFLPTVGRVAVWFTTLALIAFLWWPRREVEMPGSRWLEASDRRAIALACLVPAIAIAGWFLRSQQTVLGEAWPLVTDLPRGAGVHPRQPLAMLLQEGWYRATAGSFAEPGRDAVGVAMRSVASHSVACGVLFAVVAWHLARTMARDVASPRATAALVALLLLAQGYVVLFFGYLENYAVFALGLAVFLWCGVRAARGEWPLITVLAAWVLNLGLHLSALALLPAVVWLAAMALRRPATRRAAWRDVAFGMAMMVALDRFLIGLGAPMSLLGGLRNIVVTALASQGGGAGVGYVFSRLHARDFINAQYLIGPLASFLMVPAVVEAVRSGRLRDGTNAFLAIASAALLAGCWVTAEPALGYARDWDLFAPAGVVFTAAGARLLIVAVPSSTARSRLLAAGVALSLLHLGAWVALNHSEPRAMARFATLPLGLGRTEVVMGNWHLRNGHADEAVSWFERALRVDPRNSNAWAFLGMIHGERGEFARAAEEFRRAAEARPDKPLYRHNRIVALEKLERYEETLPEFEILCRIEPDYLQNWGGRAAALMRSGRSDAAHALLRDWLARNPSHPARADVERWLRDLGSTP